MTLTDILVKLRRIVRSVNLESKKIDKEFGISIPQLLCLQYLNERNDYQATASQIKAYLNLNASTTSGIISRLEKKALIAKVPNEADRRSVHIMLTAKGMALIGKVPTTLQEKLTVKLQQLPPEKIRVINEGIDLLTNLMELDDLEASPIVTSEEISPDNA